MGRFAPQRFRRAAAYVVVRRLRLGTGQVLEPGDPVPDTVRTHVRRWWLRRRRIGAVGDPWTEQQIARQGAPRPFGRTEDQPLPETFVANRGDDRQWTIDGVPGRSFATKRAARAWFDRQRAEPEEVPETAEEPPEAPESSQDTPGTLEAPPAEPDATEAPEPDATDGAPEED